ncbi:MAG: DUF5132 domain-containing protein [Myxococcales bacterium]|jgi:hypothetical protein
MSWFDGKVAVGFAVGFGAGMVVPKLAPELAAAARPVVKAAVKASLVAVERGREAAAHLREAVEDGVAEARAELAEGDAMEVVSASAPSDAA